MWHILFKSELNGRQVMGKRNLLLAVLAVSAVFLVSGCSTVPKKFKEEVTGIKSKVDTLESKVDTLESKQAEAERMANQQSQALEEMKSAKESNVKTNVSTRSVPVRSREHMKEVQACLKNAGFYKGKIDGMKGRGTKKAIKEFQKANGLRADGKVGAKTWEALSKYIQASAPAETAGSGAEEGATK
jgi:outer membrane murein-binding lipoprotein Lpp